VLPHMPTDVIFPRKIHIFKPSVVVDVLAIFERVAVYALVKSSSTFYRATTSAAACDHFGRRQIKHTITANTRVFFPFLQPFVPTLVGAELSVPIFSM
jgi:hypothetical protein